METGAGKAPRTRVGVSRAVLLQRVCPARRDMAASDTICDYSQTIRLESVNVPLTNSPSSHNHPQGGVVYTPRSRKVMPVDPSQRPYQAQAKRDPFQWYHAWGSLSW